MSRLRPFCVPAQCCIDIVGQILEILFGEVWRDYPHPDPLRVWQAGPVVKSMTLDTLRYASAGGSGGSGACPKPLVLQGKAFSRQKTFGNATCFLFFKILLTLLTKTMKTMLLNLNRRDAPGCPEEAFGGSGVALSEFWGALCIQKIPINRQSTATASVMKKRRRL